MEEDTVGYFLTREAFDGVVAELGGDSTLCVRPVSVKQ